MQLPEILNDLQMEEGNILLLPFEDQSLYRLVRESFTGENVDQLLKSDLSGKSFREMLKILRHTRYAAVIVSLHGAAVHRTEAAMEILLASVRAKRKFLRLEDGRYREITHSRLLFALIPRFAITLLLGILAVIPIYAAAVLAGIGLHRDIKRNLSLRYGKTLLFIRSDLPGMLTAGGSVSHIQGVISAFLKDGWSVVYMADAKMDGINPHVIQDIIRPLSLLGAFDELQLLVYNYQMIIHAARHIWRRRPSLIYQRHSVFGISGVLLSRLFRIPMVLEVNASEVWVKRNWSRILLFDLATRCEALSLRFADRISVVSSVIRDQLSPYRLASEKILVIPNGVDANAFRPDIDGTKVRQEYGLNGFVVVGFIGTFTRWHGVETLFDAACRLIPVDPRIMFLLIGDGDLRSSLHQRAVDKHIADRIVFTGMIQHAQAPQYLAACDILVSPHLGFEGTTRFFGSPTKLFEYMAMGKAIVASNLEQIGEVIQDGVNGLHMQPGDTEGLVYQLLRLARDERMRQRLGANARKDVMKNYTWDKNAERILGSFAQHQPEIR